MSVTNYDSCRKGKMLAETEEKSTHSKDRPISSVLPEYLYRELPYEKLNRMQVECLETWETDANMLISAPTGAGKTLCFELAILRVLHRALGTCIKKTITATSKNAMGKIVYIAPTKSLCSERAHDWERKFQHFGLRVKAVTGDSASSSFGSTLRNVDIVVATAEKWDSITRDLRARTPGEISSQIQLMLLDEVHQVGDSRGAVYESVVTRMLRAHDSSSTLVSSGGRAAPAALLRVIAVSATVGNVKDLAKWLRISEENMKIFDETYRPVALEYHVLGYSARNPWMYGKVYDNHILNVVSKYGEGKPSIVFCSSRRQTVISAETLLGKLSAKGSLQGQTHPFLRTSSPKQVSRLLSCAQECNNASLQRLLPHGIAIHNADMNARERNLVETLFRDSLIGCLFSTSTLAQGVNLPARLVVISGTTVYNDGCLEEYQRNLLLQMSGRAGRPGLDSRGVVVIMTSLSQVETYKHIGRDLSNNVVSQLSTRLGESINAEVARQAITNLPAAATFLANTLFCVQHNPAFNKNSPDNDLSPEEWLRSVAVSGINSLRDANLVLYDADQFGLSCTLPGTLMARYCLSVPTMRLLMTAIPTAASPAQILRVIASCPEVHEGATLRRSDKKRLNTMNEWIRMPLKGKVQELKDKVVILLQVAIGDFRSFSSCDIALRNEGRRLLQSASRVSACIIALVLHNTIKMRYETAVAALQVCRGLQNRCLWDGPTVLRQVPGISASDMRALNKAGIHTLAKLAELSSCSPDQTDGYRSAFIATLNERMKTFPRFLVRAEALSKSGREGQLVSVSIDVNVSSMCGNERPRQRASVNCFIMVGVPGMMLLKCDLFPLTDGHGTVICSLPMEKHPTVNECVDILVGCDHICGIDVKERVWCGEGHLPQPQRTITGFQKRKHMTSVKEGRVTKKRRQTKIMSKETSLLSTTTTDQVTPPPKSGSLLPLTSLPETETHVDRMRQDETHHVEEKAATVKLPHTAPERTLQTQTGTSKSRVIPDRNDCNEHRKDRHLSSERKQTPARSESHLTLSQHHPAGDNRKEYDDLFRDLF